MKISSASAHRNGQNAAPATIQLTGQHDNDRPRNPEGTLRIALTSQPIAAELPARSGARAAIRRTSNEAEELVQRSMKRRRGTALAARHAVRPADPL
jgi:hypothetical protein